MAGLVVGTTAAIGLVLVSPNMTYPLQVRATQQALIDTQRARLAEPGRTLERPESLNLQKSVALAEAEIAKLGTRTTSLVGLEAPLFSLRNPGLVSIPLGFLAVVLGSLCYRDRRAEEMWEELYVRSNTGIGRSGVSAH